MEDDRIRFRNAATGETLPDHVQSDAMRVEAEARAEAAVARAESAEERARRAERRIEQLLKR